MKVHIIQHDVWVEPGEYFSWAQRNRHDVSFTRCWLHETVPSSVEADFLIVLGGHQCPATTKEECDYFDAAAERRIIRKYADAGKAVIGVCLGAQLVGEAMEAAYEHSPEKEIGPVKAKLTEAGKADPFLRDFPPVFDAGEWHNDMPGLNEKAVILAESEGCPRQIVRYGKYVYGFQTHMEFNHGIIKAGLQDVGGKLSVEGRFVQSAEELLSYDYTEMNRLLSSFLDAMAKEYASEDTYPDSPSVSRMKKLAVFFPGIGYTLDKPLMHYSRRLAANCGFEVRLLPYSGFPEKVIGDRKYMETVFNIALKQSREMLAETDFSEYEDIVFVGKSIGTAAAAQIASEMKERDRVRCVFYTPLEETFLFPVKRAIVFTGSKDQWVGKEKSKIPGLSEQAGHPCFVIPEANHSLETGDVDRDIANMRDIMRETALFLK